MKANHPRQYLFPTDAYNSLGCHRESRDSRAGYRFRLYAPQADEVHLAGNFHSRHSDFIPMTRGEDGIFETYTHAAREFNSYEFHISYRGGHSCRIADPFAFCRADDVSKVYCFSGYHWHDGPYRRAQARKKLIQNPINIYRLDPTLWRSELGLRTAKELAVELLPHIQEMGYTHISLSRAALLSFTPTAFFDAPKDLMAFVDFFHCNEIGVILEWSPIPAAEHTAYAESLSTDELAAYLISNAVYWVSEYHLDGLYLDSTHLLHTEETDNLLRQLNKAVHAIRANIITMTDYGTVADALRPIAEGGLGFTLHWSTRYRENAFRFLSDPEASFRHPDQTTAVILSLAEPSQPCGLDPIIARMPGRYDDRFANLRLLLGCLTARPGKKLNCMGFDPSPGESPTLHMQLQNWLRDLNQFYLLQRPLWQNDNNADSFQQVRNHDQLLVFRRIDTKGREIIAVCNFSTQLRERCRFGVPKKGCYLPLLSSDSHIYGGNDVPLQTVRTEPCSADGLPYSALFTCPPLSITFYGQE